MADGTLSFTIGSTRYDVRLEDLTGEDASDFRREVGYRLAQVFDSSNFDIDMIGGLIWLVRRPAVKGLTYRECAATVTYGNFNMITDDGSEADAEGEASGGS